VWEFTRKSAIVDAGRRRRLFGESLQVSRAAFPSVHEDEGGLARRRRRNGSKAAEHGRQSDRQKERDKFVSCSELGSRVTTRIAASHRTYSANETKNSVNRSVT